MNPPTLPASPWQASPLPDSRAIVTGDGYFLLNLEGLPATPETVAALKRAFAALPDLLTALETALSIIEDIPYPGNYHAAAIESALRKAGYAFDHDQKPE